MHYRILFVLSFLIVASCFSAFAQFNQLSIEDGLSQSTVKSLIQDSRGYIWIGTADGLNRYDGYQFQVYRHNPMNSETIGGNDISCIYENPNDSMLWIGTQGKGLSLFNRNFVNFQTFSSLENNSKSIPSNFISDIKSTSKTLWIATNTGGLSFFNKNDSSFTPTKFSSQSEFKNINCLENDTEGNIWLGTPNGLYKWRYANKNNADLPEKIDIATNRIKNVTSLLLDLKGYLWIGTDSQGLFRMHPLVNEVIHFPIASTEVNRPNAKVHDILQQKNGQIWVASSNGLLKYNSKLSNFLVFKNDKTNEETLNNNMVYSLFEDKSGILWIGTYLGGLNVLDPMTSRFPKYNSFSELKKGGTLTNDIRSVYFDSNKTLWVGTSEGLIEVSNFTSTISDSNSKIHLKDRRIGALLRTKNELFVSTNLGILIKNKQNTFINFSQKIKNDHNLNITAFNSGIIDEMNQIWLGTPDGLLKCSPDLKSFILATPSDALTQNDRFYIMSLTEDINGTYWIGTFNGCIYSYDRYSDKFELVLEPEPANRLKSFSKIFSICSSIPGELWIGTNLGLYCYNINTKAIEAYLKDNGLANEVIYAVLADNNQNVWCCTNLGISMRDHKTGEIKNFNYQDGLQSNEFNQGAYHIDDNGIIYMGGINGLNVFDPNNIELNTYLPKVVLTDFEVQHVKVNPKTHPEISDKHISESASVYLSHKQNSFSFEFTSLSFSISDRNKYQYALTKMGEQDLWIDAGKSRTATYTNIDPGNYYFKVMGSNSDGLYNSIPTSVKIYIKPSYFQTWWFRITLLLTFLLLIYLFMYLRIRTISRQKIKLKKLVKLKTREIEKQNIKLKNFNEKILKNNKNIKENNSRLQKQREHLVKQRDMLISLSEKVGNENQNKLRFFTSISHELRTPLTLILNPLKEILDLSNDSNSEIKLRGIYRNASKLLLTVNQLLDFRKAETENLKLKISCFELFPFIQECCYMFNEIALQREININISTKENSLMIWADKDLLEKTMFNLISHAFTTIQSKGFVQIEIDSTKRNETKFVIISVKDNGIAISPDKLDSVFERFYENNEPLMYNESVSGLELALVKKYIEQHDGEVTVRSTPPSGNEFRIILPLEKDHFSEEVFVGARDSKSSILLGSSIGSYVPELQSKTKSQNKGKHSLLLVESNIEMNNFLTGLLSKYFKVSSASSVKQAISLTKTKIPDIIVSEVILKDKSGYKLIEALKTDFKTSHIPIIILTTLSDQEDQLKGIKAGCDAFITKPFDLQHLLIQIYNLIDKNKILSKKFNFSDSVKNEEPELIESERLFIQRATQKIIEHLDDRSFNVSELCTFMNLSQPQCYRKIKSLTGLNISEFIRNTRLKEAVKLMKNGEYNISEVAYKSGFNDPSYFTKSFFKLYGMSPREFSNTI